MEVSHAELHGELTEVKTAVAVIQHELQRQDSMISDTRLQVERIKETLSDGKAKFAEIGQNITGIHSTLIKMDGRLEGLIADENQRKGRDGMIGEILKSPVTGWISALSLCVAGLIAWFLTVGAG